MNPSVSVIVPVYNAQPYLRQCMESLVGQTLREIELICVDDGSTDGSGDILAEYAARDERVRVITQGNAGSGAARNRGLREAHGKYIAFVDADDEVAPRYLELLCHALEEHPTADFSWCEYRRQYEPEDTSAKVSAVLCPRPLEHHLLRRRPFLPSLVTGRLFRVSLLQGLEFPETIKWGEDILFLYNALHLAKDGVCVSPRLYMYREHEESLVNCPVTLQRIDHEIICGEEMEAFYRSHSLSRREERALRRLIAKRFFRMVMKLIKCGDSDGSKGWLGLYMPRLRELEQRGIFHPADLSLKQRLRYWFYKRRYATC